MSSQPGRTRTRTGEVGSGFAVRLINADPLPRDLRLSALRGLPCRRWSATGPDLDYKVDTIGAYRDAWHLRRGNLSWTSAV
jgi:hypothetical protein